MKCLERKISQCILPFTEVEVNNKTNLRHNSKEHKITGSLRINPQSQKCKLENNSINKVKRMD